MIVVVIVIMIVVIRGDCGGDGAVVALAVVLLVVFVVVVARGVSPGIAQGPEKNTNMKSYFLEAGFDVLPAVPGRRATNHD